MKTALRNSLILSSYLARSAILHGVWGRRNGRAVTRIVALHKVKDEAAFERKIHFLASHFHAISLQDFLDNRVSATRTNIVVTFDDGYSSWLQGLGVLRRYGVPAVYLVNSGYLEATQKGKWAEYCRERLGVSPEPSVTWNDLRSMAKQEGVEVGGHTVDHQELGASASLARVWREIRDDKERIEEALGKRVPFFAYPFGHPGTFWSGTASMVKEAGYESALTLVPGANTQATGRFSLHRDSLDHVNSRLLLKAWLSGAYDPLKGTVMSVGALARRIKG